ncbi:zinc finger MYND domain-containing protein 12-like isoform X2 [Babylonia areolata]|uniref:zinc finger MYND domain-containing protein 12-like isoform X2 n=1 Tax=Babylonia areolata TaxID=304850 RepID=UPI003FD01DE1
MTSRPWPCLQPCRASTSPSCSTAQTPLNSCPASSSWPRPASVVWGKLSQAKDYLGRASWMLLKTPDAPAAIKSNLHRVQGQLYAAKGKDAEALREFAEDIYQATVAYGTDHIETSGGYFHMANIFFRQGRRLVADSIYRQVTNMWHAYLHRIFMYQTRPAPVPQGVGPGVVIDTEPVVPGLKNLEKLEGLTFLSTIHELRKAQTRCPKREMMLVCLTLGMLQFMLENFNEAKDLGLKAMVLGRQDPHSELSRQAIHFLSICETVKTRA